MNKESLAFEERRVFERYAPVNHAFVMFNNCFGIIKNVSLGGAAVYSVHDYEQELSLTLEVFLLKSGFSLDSEQFDLVSSRPTPGKTIKLHHINFKNLSAVQLDSLWRQISQTCLRAADDSFWGRSNTNNVSFERHENSLYAQPIRTDSAVPLSLNGDNNSVFASCRIQ